MAQPLSLKIGVSGVRGIVGEALTPQLVTSFAAAFGTYCGEGRVVLGTDTRPSRVMVAHAVVAGLLSVGRTPVDLGIVPVPTLQLFTRDSGAAGGICITASHNPEEWNALKFFGSDGIVLRPNQFEELVDLYHQGTYPRVAAGDIADAQTDVSASQRHLEAVLRAVDAAAVRERRFKVVVDACNGAASRSAPELLRALDCDVTELNTEPEAAFPRNPEPLPENLGVLGERVRGSGADIGFALDADADRLAVVDEGGQPLGEDATIALVVRRVVSQRPGAIVVSASTSRMLDDIAEEYGCRLERSKVGEINVVERMLECGAEIGGEGTGGVIALNINPCRDSFVGMAYILEALAHSDGSVGALRRSLPQYFMVTRKITCRARDVSPALRLLRHLYRDERLDLIDGVKVVWGDRWLHVRGSNTEPIIRVTAEAAVREDAERLVERVLEYLRPVVG